jgi:hypothetical protein
MAPFVKLAKTITDQRSGIEAAIQDRLSTPGRDQRAGCGADHHDFPGQTLMWPFSTSNPETLLGPPRSQRGGALGQDDVAVRGDVMEVNPEVAADLEAELAEALDPFAATHCREADVDPHGVGCEHLDRAVYIAGLESARRNLITASDASEAFVVSTHGIQPCGVKVLERLGALDEILVRHAKEAGAQVRTATMVTALVIERGRVVGVTTTAGELRAVLVVGADGTRSAIREAVYAAGVRAWPELHAGIAGARREGPLHTMANMRGFFRESANSGRRRYTRPDSRCRPSQTPCTTAAASGGRFCEKHESSCAARSAHRRAAGQTASRAAEAPRSMGL